MVGIANTPIEVAHTTRVIDRKAREIGVELAVDHPGPSGRIEFYPQPAPAHPVVRNRRRRPTDRSTGGRRPTRSSDKSAPCGPGPVPGHRRTTTADPLRACCAGHESGSPGPVEVTGGNPSVRCGDGNCLVIEQAQLAGSRPADWSVSRKRPSRYQRRPARIGHPPQTRIYPRSRLSVP